MRYRRAKHSDYSRVEEYLEEIAPEIEMEWGESFEKLPQHAQTQALLDHFFKGIPQYWESANDLRRGLRVFRQIGEFPIRVSTFRMRGTERKVIRDVRTGRFRQWVKE